MERFDGMNFWRLSCSGCLFQLSRVHCNKLLTYFSVLGSVSNVYILLGEISCTLVLLNSATTCFVYIMMKEYREEMKSVCCLGTTPTRQFRSGRAYTTAVMSLGRSSEIDRSSSMKFYRLTNGGSDISGSRITRTTAV